MADGVREVAERGQGEGRSDDERAWAAGGRTAHLVGRDQRRRGEVVDPGVAEDEEVERGERDDGAPLGATTNSAAPAMACTVRIAPILIRDSPGGSS